MTWTPQLVHDARPLRQPVWAQVSVMADGNSILESGRRTFEIEARAISGLAGRLGADFVEAVRAILCSRGRVAVSGTGKSGLVGRKIAATLASTGTPSFFMHPTEALHGDLGMLTSEDIVIAISKSGEDGDILSLVPFVSRRCQLLIAIVGSRQSTLARKAALALDVSVEREACPLDLAPTASSTAALAMGDALAVALIHERGLRPSDFAELHPGGSLGRRLLTRVEDLMASHDLPLVHPDQDVKSVILKVTEGRLGLAVVMADEVIAGIITDGDLRRVMDRTDRFLDLRAKDIMNAEPKRIAPNVLAVEGQRLMARHLITSLLVTSDGRTLLGILHIHHLNAAFHPWLS